MTKPPKNVTKETFRVKNAKGGWSTIRVPKIVPRYLRHRFDIQTWQHIHLFQNWQRVLDHYPWNLPEDAYEDRREWNEFARNVVNFMRENPEMTWEQVKKLLWTEINRIQGQHNQ